MAKRIDPILSESETIIGTGVNIKGTLIGDGDVAVDGRIVGEIKTRGNLALGVNAVVKANVTAVNLKVSGELTGNVSCSGETHLTETGKIVGDIETGTLQIEAGGIFIGHSHMTETEVHDMPDDEDATPNSRPELSPPKRL